MSSKYCIAVCDDETEDRNEIEEMTREICKEEQIDAHISLYENGESLLKDFRDGNMRFQPFAILPNR